MKKNNTLLKTFFAPKHHTFLFLALVVLLGAFLRIYRIVDVPPSLNWDEISHGYNAYSLLKTGSDEWGQKFPLANFRAYGDYPLPANLYLTIPFVAALGLSELSIRLPHALLGVLTILASYALVFGITKRSSVSLLAALLVATEPWFFFTSRFVLQSNVSVFFLTAGMAAFFNRHRHRSLLPLAVLCVGLTLYSYHTTRIFTPLLAFSLIALYRRELATRLSIVIFLLFFLPLPFILMNPESRARSNEVFLINPGIVSSIESSRNNSTLPPIVSKLVYNRPSYVIQQFSKNYIGYFSPQFLFVNGGTQYQFSVPNHGLMYFFSMPFFYLGLLILLVRTFIKRDKTYIALTCWLFLAPIPASITTEPYAVLRATAMLPVPELLAALGAFSVYDSLKKRPQLKNLYIASVVVVLLGSLAFYAQTYFGEYRTTYSWAWQYGYKEVVNYSLENASLYDQIITTKKYGEPHEFFLFYGKVDPGQYKSDSALNRFTQSNWWWVDGFNKYIFVNDWQIPKEGSTFVTESKKVIECKEQRCLLITSPSNAPRGWRLVKEIHFLDGAKAFEIYEN